MTLLIERSKTSIYRDGNKLYIAKTGSDLSPVSILKLYLEKVKIFSDEDYIFCQLAHLKSANEYKLWSTNKPISYFRLNEMNNKITRIAAKRKCSQFNRQKGEIIIRSPVFCSKPDKEVQTDWLL